MTSKKKKLDVFLHEVFKQFIALKDEDFKKSQEVFKSVFEQVRQKMAEQCNFFSKYGTQILYGGSVSDGIKVGKLDEFDMDIVIRLPINYDDGEDGIIIESDQPGFVKLKIMRAFDNLDKQKEWETHHKVTREWRDSDKYFLQNKFRSWLHGIVQKALNVMDGKVDVNGVVYLLKYRTSGPAYTLNIRNDGGEEFALDVDLVPVIRFMRPRWPPGYREVDCKVKDWLVVPKPNKAIQDNTLQNRCWRLSFQDQERELMKDCQQLKTTIRLLKKLRDAQGMKCIASYYIKTLFLWKIEKTDKKFWQNKLSVVFREMVNEFYEAIKNKNIPYFWDEKNNLIANIKPSIQKLYADTLKSILNSIDSNDVDKTIYALLTTDEKIAFKNSEFYKEQEIVLSRQQSIASAPLMRQQSVSSASEVDLSRKTVNSGQRSVSSSSEVDFSGKSNLEDIVKSLVKKVEALTIEVEMQKDRITILEQERNYKDNLILNSPRVIDTSFENEAKNSEPYSQNSDINMSIEKTILLDLSNDDSNVSFNESGGSQPETNSIPIEIHQDLLLL